MEENLRVFGFILILSAVAYCQNLQVHYDFGQNRNYVTTTFEMFKADDYGATFWFIDMDYNKDKDKSMSLAYLELARYFSFSLFKPFSVTVQYNDGISDFGSLGQVWLTGFSLPLSIGSAYIAPELLYRYQRAAAGMDLQFTLAWIFSRQRIEFAGYCDIWTQDKMKDKKELAVQTEPQIWYNFNDHFAAGSEVEISKNVLPGNGWNLMPTFAIRYIF